MSAFYVPIRRLSYITLGAIDKLLSCPQPQVFILCYHSISDDGWNYSVPFSEFKRQISFLKRTRYFISLSDLALNLKHKKYISHPSVIITFDDGYSDIFQVKDFLKSLNIHPTVFVLSDSAHANRQELDTNKPMLNTSQLKTLVTAGWEIGCHTATHPNMNTRSRFQSEIINSKNVLEKKLGLKIKSFAYPKGRYNKAIINSVKKAKYEVALSMDDSQLNLQSDIFTLPRIGISGSHSLHEFQVLGSPLVAKLRSYLKSQGYGR